nr:hypothetical protein [Obesumbacterium proteus]
MIIGNGPVPDNPFGHGAAANRYGLMSSGTGDKVGSSVTDYLKKCNREEIVGFGL